MSHIKKLISAKTGKISFRVHIRTNQKTITKTFKLKKDALSFSRTIEGNANIKDALTEPLLNRTFSDLLLIYPSEKSRLKYFNDYFGDLKLNQIKKSHIVFALDSLKLAPATINRYKNDFGSFSKWVNRQLDDTKWNPQQGIQRKTEPESRQDYLSHDQQKELLNQCKLVKGKLYLYVLTALSTGLRKGELNALQWRDIQWVDRVAVIRGEDEGAGKTGYREVPLSIRIMTELHKNRDISVKGKIFTQSFRKQWYKVRKLAGISDSFVFHSLRHTAASNMAKAGKSLLQIGTILGHKSTQTTLRYAHLIERAALHDITGEAMAHLG